MQVLVTLRVLRFTQRHQSPQGAGFRLPAPRQKSLLYIHGTENTFTST